MVKYIVDSICSKIDLVEYFSPYFLDTQKYSYFQENPKYRKCALLKWFSHAKTVMRFNLNQKYVNFKINLRYTS